MPTYEYACPKCDHQFEHFQSMSDELLRKCPRCNKTGLKRLVGGGAGLIFKGTGFYITDYKNKGAGKKEGGESKASPATKSASPASTPAAAPSAAPAAAKSSAAKK